jgi:hypothetical protein
MTLSTLDRRLPPFAVVLVAAVCGSVLAASSAVAVSRNTAAPHAAARGTGGPAGGTQSPSATPGPSATPSPSATPAPAPPKKKPGIADYLVPLDDKVPGYDRVPDSVAGAGPMDLTKAATIDGGGKAPTAAQKALFRRLGFVRGHSRVWDDGTNTVVIMVYEWSTAVMARTYLRAAATVHARKGDAWTPATAHAVGSCRTKGGDAVDGEVLQVGRHTFIVGVLRDGSCRRHEAVAKVSALQLAHAAALDE